MTGSDSLWYPNVSKVEGGFRATLESPLYDTEEQAWYAMNMLMDAITDSKLGAFGDNTDMETKH